MFSDDRFMTLATGLVLAIAVGAIAQNSGMLMDFFGGGSDSEIATQDDQFTVMAGRSQILDVLSNDEKSGDITLLGRPTCGLIRKTDENSLEFYDSGNCEGDVEFAYCVEGDSGCLANTVKLTVIASNKPKAEKPASTVASNDAAANPMNPASRSRKSAGQILLQEEEELDVAVSGFGGAAAPTLFAPDTTELITPQETVATLKRSVAAIAPSTSQRDQNINRQQSARTQMNLAIATDGMQSDINVGDSGSGVTLGGSVSRPSLGGIDAPSAPSFGAAPSAPRMAAVAPSMMALPGGGSDAGIKIEERGPSVNAFPPRVMSFAKVSEPRILVPSAIRHTSRFVVAAAMEQAAPAGTPATPDTETAPVGNVMVASDKTGGSTQLNSNNVTVANTTIDRRYAGGMTTLTGGDGIEILAGPKVATAAPSNIDGSEAGAEFDGAEIQIADGSVELAANAALGSVSNDLNINVGDTNSIDAGTVNIATGKLIDQSDVVVEMAAQILLPSARIGGLSLNSSVSSAQISGLLTDSIYVPDLTVSAPPVAEPEVEVASLGNGPEVDVKAALQRDVAPVAAQCPVNLSASARPGGEIALFLSSNCRSGQIVTIEHAGLQFSERTSAGGTLSISFPAMSEISFITATFEDGAQGEASLSVRDAGKVERMAIVWSAPVELDLHAYEGGGARSDGNHVWEGAPRSYRETLTRGGGYLVTYGDPEIIGGSRTEVYSLPTTRVRATVTVNMDLNVGDASQICDDDIGLKTVRTQKGRDVEVRSFNLRVPGCSVASAGMVLENFTDALEVSRR